MKTEQPHTSCVSFCDLADLRFLNLGIHFMKSSDHPYTPLTKTLHSKCGTARGVTTKRMASVIHPLIGSNHVLIETGCAIKILLTAYDLFFE
jgi:hypothetical protein